MSTIYFPRKIIYAPNDPFFDEGNIALRSIRLQKEAQSQAEINAIKEEESHLVGIYTKEIYCNKCHIKLPNVPAYERHYESIHKNVCIECHRIFPDFDWLQLHLDEYHNALLQIKKSQGEKIYRCFVKRCIKSFSTQHKRRLHLKFKHHYPEYFPFDLVRTGTLSFKERKIKDQINRKRQEKRQKKQLEQTTKKDNEQKVMPMSKDVDTAMEDLSTSMAKLSLPKSISFGRRSPAIYQSPRPAQKPHQTIHETEDDQQDVEMKVRRPRKRGPKKKRPTPNNMEL